MNHARLGRIAAKITVLLIAAPLGCGFIAYAWDVNFVPVFVAFVLGYMLR